MRYLTDIDTLPQDVAGELAEVRGRVSSSGTMIAVVGVLCAAGGLAALVGVKTLAGIFAPPVLWVVFGGFNLLGGLALRGCSEAARQLLFKWYTGFAVGMAAVAVVTVFLARSPAALIEGAWPAYLILAAVQIVFSRVVGAGATATMCRYLDTKLTGGSTADRLEEASRSRFTHISGYAAALLDRVKGAGPGAKG